MTLRFRRPPVMSETTKASDKFVLLYVGHPNKNIDSMLEVGMSRDRVAYAWVLMEEEAKIGILYSISYWNVTRGGFYSESIGHDPEVGRKIEQFRKRQNRKKIIL